MLIKIELDFWSDLKDTKDDNKSLLFVGNDLNRDYSFLIQLVIALPNLNFKVVSKRITNEELNFDNVSEIKTFLEKVNNNEESVALFSSKWMLKT